RIAERLVIENDDGIFNIADVLETGIELGMPVVFDNLHNFVNPATGAGSDSYWIDCCSTTWRKKDGRQKIHYSQQDPLKKTGSHSSSIRSDEFLRFIEGIGRRDIDMMLEVKDKNLSAVKCINLLAETGKTKALELEWGKYKYKVLEGSPAGYNSIRSLLKDKRAYPAVEFYRLIEESLAVVPSGGHIINAASHVWGYFKDKANGKEKNEFARLTEGLTEGSVKPVAIRKFLYRMTQKYDEKYLMDSYYFIDQ
ncbi:MAG: DUF1722 domain-containing protein, partial [Clostridiales bacterium]|nr:DUF1722 domain-containing protein [Clostridiales bacterium]